MSQRVGPAATPVDDCFHPHTDHWWETETAWFGFCVPERRLGGWLYTQTLPVQGICKGGAWVWDDSDAGALYERQEHALPLEDRGDLRDVSLPNGNTIRMLEPLTRYQIGYSDPGNLEVDLVFEALMPPHSHPEGVPPFAQGRHIDQPGRVTGHLVLHGERIEVDCFSSRDRSWGPRPLGPDPRKPPREPSQTRPPGLRSGVGYVFAVADEANAFLAFTVPDEEGRDDVTAGYLLRDGVYSPLVSGHRKVTFAPITRFLDGIHLEAVDEQGRELVADGALIARHGTTGPSGTGLFRWTWDGSRVGWGEDQSYCSERVWQAHGAPPPAS